MQIPNITCKVNPWKKGKEASEKKTKQKYTQKFRLVGKKNTTANIFLRSYEM